MQGRDAGSGQREICRLPKDTKSWILKDVIRKAKAHLKSNLVRNMKGKRLPEAYQQQKES